MTQICKLTYKNKLHASFGEDVASPHCLLMFPNLLQNWRNSIILLWSWPINSDSINEFRKQIIYDPGPPKMKLSSKETGKHIQNTIKNLISSNRGQLHMIFFIIFYYFLDLCRHQVVVAFVCSCVCVSVFFPLAFFVFSSSCVIVYHSWHETRKHILNTIKNLRSFSWARITCDVFYFISFIFSSSFRFVRLYGGGCFFHFIFVCTLFLFLLYF